MCEEVLEPHDEFCQFCGEPVSQQVRKLWDESSGIFKSSQHTVYEHGLNDSADEFEDHIEHKSKIQRRMKKWQQSKKYNLKQRFHQKQLKNQLINNAANSQFRARAY